MTIQRHPLVVIEGMDGSGKSTLAQAVAERLNATLFRFPTEDGVVGKLIRQGFAGEVAISSDMYAYLMIADGLDAAPVLEDHLRNAPVVCDRHTTVSGWVYQQDVYSLDAVLAIQQRGQFRTADVVFILDVPGDVVTARIDARAGERNELFEKRDPDYVATLRRRYLAYQFMHDNAVLLDGALPTADLVEQVLAVLRAIDEGSS